MRRLNIMCRYTVCTLWECLNVLTQLYWLYYDLTVSGIVFKGFWFNASVSEVHEILGRALINFCICLSELYAYFGETMLSLYTVLHLQKNICRNCFAWFYENNLTKQLKIMVQPWSGTTPTRTGDMHFNIPVAIGVKLCRASSPSGTAKQRHCASYGPTLSATLLQVSRDLERKHRIILNKKHYCVAY